MSPEILDDLRDILCKLDGHGSFDTRPVHGPNSRSSIDHIASAIEVLMREDFLCDDA